MAKTYPVKWRCSEMQGAPQHTKQTEGLLISTLKTLLVTGFGDLVADSVVYDTDKGWAKATFGSGHSYLKDSVIEVTGSTPEDYNGEHLIKLVDTNNVWFELDTAPFSDAAGRLIMRYPSLGWSISHESVDGLVAIFKSAGDIGDVYLRVDNTPYSGYKKDYYWTAKVQMVTDVVDLDTCEILSNHGNDHWNSCSNIEEPNDAWKIVGDNRFFNWFTKAGAGYRYDAYMAGYIDTLKVGDRYHFIVDGGNDVTTSEYYHQTFNINETSSSNYYRAIARKYHQLEGVANLTYGFLIDVKSSSKSYGVTAPNKVDNSFIICEERPFVFESISNDKTSSLNLFDIRGFLPHIREVLTQTSAYSGKVLYKNDKLYFFVATSISNVSSDYQEFNRLLAFDITSSEV